MVVVDVADVVDVIPDVVDVGAIARYGENLSSSELLGVEVDESSIKVAILCEKRQNGFKL